MIERREFLNHKLPCSSLKEKPPLVAFPEAVHSGRFYRAELEKELLDLERVERFLEKGAWFRRVSEVSTVSLGGFVYYVKGSVKGRQLEIGYEACGGGGGGGDDQRWRLVFKDEAGELVGCQEIKGLSVGELLGEIEPHVVSVPYAFQLRLPFTLAEEQGVTRVCETMAA